MMPFGPIDRPSLGLSLLSRCLGEAGFPTRVLYPALAFAAQIGNERYDDIALHFSRGLVGEWLFSQALDPIGDHRDFVRSAVERHFDGVMPTKGKFADLARDLPALVAQTRAFIDATVEEIVRLQPRVVGLTSSYHQHLACLALARRLKERQPDLLVVLGGANCNDPMGAETFRRFSFVDAVVCGPGEVALVELVRRHLQGHRGTRLAGVYWRAVETEVPVDALERHATEPALDTLPFPDFEDFFAAWRSQGGPALPRLPIEASRGCWWGEKQHCVFCSENAHSMRYRRKSSDRLAAEFEWMLSHYPGHMICATDEILDPRLIGSLMPRLAAVPGKKRIFFSLKANIRKADLVRLADAGVVALQPGIESLADEILKPMRKGVSALQNIQLLKWCRELGIAVSWGILYGFPYEEARSYDRMVARLPLLAHLDPPTATSVALQRFSPLFEQAASFGIRDVVPDAGYRLIYRADEPALARLAYRFDWHCDRALPVEDYARPLRRSVDHWESVAAQSFLACHDEGGRLVIADTRPIARRRIQVLSGLEREVYLACDRIQPVHAIVRAAGEAGYDASEASIAELLAARVDDGLVVREGDLHLALAVRVNRRFLPPVGLMAEMLAAARSDALAAAHEQHDPAGARGVDRHLAEGVELDP
jgi:ribosomal peptide maturation radical SAM protein 1